MAGIETILLGVGGQRLQETARDGKRLIYVIERWNILREKGLAGDLQGQLGRERDGSHQLGRSGKLKD